MTERRRAARFAVEGGGRTLTVSPVEILNMSVGGAAFRTVARLNVGDEYTLRLEVGGRTIVVLGVVAWCTVTELEKRGDDTIPVYAVGMRFPGILSKEGQGLVEFIDEHKLILEHRLAGLRFRVDGPAAVEHPRQYTVRMVSAHGMLIESDQPMGEGDERPFEIALEGQAPIHVRGRVAYCKEKLDETPRHFAIGIEFVDKAPAEAERLEDVLKALASPESPPAPA